MIVSHTFFTYLPEALVVAQADVPWNVGKFICQISADRLCIKAYLMFARLSKGNELRAREGMAHK